MKTADRCKKDMHFHKKNCPLTSAFVVGKGTVRLFVLKGI
jgi:hypothetical protein